MLFDDGGHDGQAQTGAAGLAGTRGVGAVETLKDALAILAVNTGAVVAHLKGSQRESRNLLAHAHRNLQGRAVGGVTHRVGQQVRHDLTHARFIAEHRRGGGGNIVAEAHERNLAVGGRSVGVVAGVHRQVKQIEGCQLGFSALVDAGQCQQVLDELAHALGLRLDAAHGGADRLLGGKRALAVELRITADTHQRGA